MEDGILESIQRSNTIIDDEILEISSLKEKRSELTVLIAKKESRVRELEEEKKKFISPDLLTLIAALGYSEKSQKKASGGTGTRTSRDFAYLGNFLWQVTATPQDGEKKPEEFKIDISRPDWQTTLKTYCRARGFSEGQIGGFKKDVRTLSIRKCLLKPEQKFAPAVLEEKRTAKKGKKKAAKK